MKRLAGPLLLLCSLAHADVYKWLDETGKTHYSDAPPLQNQSRGVAELSRQGTVRKPAESEAQRQSREASAAAARQLQQKQQEAARHDQALVQSYSTLADLQADRAKQLAVLQSAYHAQELRAQGLAIQQRDLQKDLALSQKLRQTPPANTLHNQQVLQREQKDLQTQMAAKHAEIEAFKLKMQQDLQRYRQLRGQ
ncbi:DUF4124 domain-containing protein [Chromobacterium alticapitis]|uniref:DUF4124 domain-containing protein n=1 Tax=Chromobacterium alticapitis TaxID=2073169 RepID=A0A2S5DJH9_9NEIS|nr:DUF4124 domain-containing protein [Chromobacterium alticapitis]POZ63265.1 DUF4124 domain-containing protein [Chromobacterium alticapitis]